MELRRVLVVFFHPEDSHHLNFVYFCGNIIADEGQGETE